jgi:hypothetical protein
MVISVQTSIGRGLGSGVNGTQRVSRRLHEWGIGDTNQYHHLKCNGERPAGVFLGVSANRKISHPGRMLRLTFRPFGLGYPHFRVLCVLEASDVPFWTGPMLCLQQYVGSDHFARVVSGAPVVEVGSASPVGYRCKART